MTKITSNVKSWLYGDLLIKPEELVMYRSPSHGGLGVHNVKCKAMAGLIKSFMETAFDANFRRSQYHSVLYQYHVLGDMSLPNPGFPPFYSLNFFQTIRKIRDDSTMDVSIMAERDWYNLILKAELLSLMLVISA